jgi:hypothetical protein
LPHGTTHKNLAQLLLELNRQERCACRLSPQ